MQDSVKLMKLTEMEGSHPPFLYALCKFHTYYLVYFQLVLKTSEFFCHNGRVLKNSVYMLFLITTKFREVSFSTFSTFV